MISFTSLSGSSNLVSFFCFIRMLLALILLRFLILLYKYCYNFWILEISNTESEEYFLKYLNILRTGVEYWLQFQILIFLRLFIIRIIHWQPFLIRSYHSEFHIRVWHICIGELDCKYNKINRIRNRIFMIAIVAI